MTAGINVDISGMPEVRKLLSQVEGRELQNRTRRGLRAGVKVMREALRAEAASRSDLPRSFQKTRTRAHRNPLGVSVSPGSPLSSIFEGGAKRHPIGEPGQLLSNFSTRRQAANKHTGGFFMARGPVTHPGMRARPLIGPVFGANEGKALDAVADELFEGLK